MAFFELKFDLGRIAEALERIANSISPLHPTPSDSIAHLGEKSKLLIGSDEERWLVEQEEQRRAEIGLEPGEEDAFQA
jgi:hypothetical protein